MNKCSLCSTEMIQKKWKIDFLIEGKFVSILNYPLMLCPKCANISNKEKINKKVIAKLYEKTKAHCYNFSAIKFEEHF